MPREFSAPHTARPTVAIAHDYLTQLGGAEKTVLAMSRAFPDAPIYTMLYDPEGTFPEFKELDVRVPAINRVKVLRKHHRAALPLFPLVAGAMHVDADVVISSSSGWAHGFRTTGRKLVYCHSPARWLYQADSYLGDNGNTIAKLGLRALSSYLINWDRRAAFTSDRYLANSAVIRERIQNAYGIEAEVVFPPVTMARADTVRPMPEVTDWLGTSTLGTSTLGGADGAFYLVVSRLLPYKNVDAIVRAFADSERRLVVVGRGPQADRLRAMKTPNVTMVSDISDGELAWLYKNCRAIIAASYEDYGLTPLEAGVWGRPAIALRYGGFLDTIDEGISGMYFDEPTSSDIREAVDRFEMTKFDSDKVRDHVKQFSEAAFSDKLHAAVNGLVAVKR
ncbi:glycosyl transferase [Mycobacterium antarcticum]|uniref:glycosyltransferase n=2 Tax=unclassified Mycolicibacterium TaxID=2636767 RepID=UPI0023A43855|nr:MULTISPECIES: glycosyltransferase [unclassified Mycolicibacterium]BDX33883.1 glycosyl transferase [Mycolicibacterium sp. TUM20985]GLP77057.1 glycosyl transferase [Mycolicibacterium sp. TUM20983]GLP82521.1 glycosyl transferase [Mycolicibacterium sp. TUM20984]